MSSNIWKLYVVFATSGLVLWYGIDKLFMQESGYGPWLIGLAVLTLQATAVLFDIPIGWATDRFGRKLILLGSAASLLASSVLMGWNPHMTVYLIGVFCYGLHVASVFTAAEALLYDTLDSLGRKAEFGILYGRCEMCMLLGYAAATLTSGYIAQEFGFRAAFGWSLVPAGMCLLATLTLRDTQLHQSVANTGKFQEAKAVLGSLAFAPLLRALIIVMCLLWVTEAFKEGFGQLYMERYAASFPGLPDGMTITARVALLFAIFYLLWSIGGLIGGKMTGAWRHVLIVLSVLPLVVMSFVDSWVSVIGFMAQAIAVGALFVQIVTELHDAIPASVRGTVSAIRTFIGRVSTLPFIFLIGVLTDRFDIRWGLWLTTVFAVLALGVWMRYIWLERRAAVLLTGTQTP